MSGFDRYNRAPMSIVFAIVFPLSMASGPSQVSENCHAKLMHCRFASTSGKWSWNWVMLSVSLLQQTTTAFLSVNYKWRPSWIYNVFENSTNRQRVQIEINHFCIFLPALTTFIRKSTHVSVVRYNYQDWCSYPLEISCCDFKKKIVFLPWNAKYFNIHV